MKILFTNDDGYDANGIISLYQVFSKDEKDIVNRLIVVAPDRDRSVSGHSITYQVPVRIREIYKNGKIEIYSCTGTTADCVIVTKGYLEKNIDLIISGINRGANLGLDLTISGTFSGVIEGSVNNIPGIAVSLFQYDDPDYTFASIFIYEFVARYRKYLKKFNHILLNVNLPPFNSLNKDIFPIVTYQSRFRHVAHLEPRHDPRQNLYFWIYWKKKIIQLDGINFQEKIQKYLKGECEISDIECIYNNAISITPILLDFNIVRNESMLDINYKDFSGFYKELKSILIEISKEAYLDSISKVAYSES
ncbi:MAG: 5'/3'-nucleotidase SurE [bacterium]